MSRPIALYQVDPRCSQHLLDKDQNIKYWQINADADLSEWDKISSSARAVVLGQKLTDPTSVLTRLGRANRELPVYILRPEDARNELVTRLRFIPSIGRHVRIWDANNIPSLIPELETVFKSQTLDTALQKGLAVANAKTQKVALGAPERLSEVMESAPVGIVMLDTQGRITHLNKAASALFGWPPANAKNRTITERFQAHNQETIQQLIQTCLSGRQSSEIHSVAFRHPIRRDQIDLQVSAGRLGSHHSTKGCVVYLDDVSELMKSQKELARAREELERKVRERTKALSQVREHLEDRTQALEKSYEELLLTKEQLELLSISDSLTGLYNRRYLDQHLPAECRRMQRYEKPLSVLMLDIDHFKAYNDNLGHVAGDECLVKVAEIIKSACRRAGEFAIRYGGEEFCLALPHCDEKSAQDTANLIIQTLEHAAIPHPQGGVVSLSIGIACAQNKALSDYKHILKAADKALYQAKENGRNQSQVCVLNERPH